MHVQTEIDFNDLLRIVKNLPQKQLVLLKKEIEENSLKNARRENFKDFLLKGPTFSKKQLENIAKTRKAINQWRTK
jgi:hypothetical protein